VAILNYTDMSIWIYSTHF